MQNHQRDTVIDHSPTFANHNQIGKLVGASSFHVNDQHRDKKLYSLSSGKQSTPIATSSQISPIDGNTSSYLQPQGFSKDGRPILK